MPNIVLITSFYKARDPKRILEYDHCLAINCASNIDKIIIFFEGDENGAAVYPAMRHDKVKVIYIDKRPTWKLFIDYANKNLIGDSIIISCGDIYFDQNSNIERARELKPNHLWALTRYNFNQENQTWTTFPKGFGAYDSWFFLAPIKSEKNYDILFGLTGSDSYFVQKAIENGLCVSDVCLSIISKHTRESKEVNKIITVNEKPWDYHMADDYMDYLGRRITFRVFYQYLYSGLMPGLPRHSCIEDNNYVTSLRFPTSLLFMLRSLLKEQIKPYLKRCVSRLK